MAHVEGLVPQQVADVLWLPRRQVRLQHRLHVVGMQFHMESCQLMAHVADLMPRQIALLRLAGGRDRLQHGLAKNHIRQIVSSRCTITMYSPEADASIPCGKNSIIPANLAAHLLRRVADVCGIVQRLLLFIDDAQRSAHAAAGVCELLQQEIRSTPCGGALTKPVCTSETFRSCASLML